MLYQEQFHGRIASAHSTRGFCVVLEGQKFGSAYWLPPDLRPFAAAPRGEYRLRSTGEVVVDPDLTANWIVRKHQAETPRSLIADLKRHERRNCSHRTTE
jgi:hypothetical protein